MPNHTRSRREFLQVLGGGAVASLSPTCGARRDDTNSGQRPNIVLIMADDMGFSDVGCYGSEIETLNIDGLARNGLRFTQFYNAARCCPTRAALLSGLYPHQAGVGHMTEDRGYPAYRGDLNRQCVTIAEALRPAGYRTAMSGKWHVTGPDISDDHNWPLKRGFERYYGTLIGGGNYYNPKALIRDNESIEVAEEDHYLTDAVNDQAVEFIEAFGTKAEPFFLYVAHSAPHWPLQALPEDISKYQGRYRKGWDAVRNDRHAKMVEMGLIDPQWSLSARDVRVPAWDETPHKDWEARRMAVYAAQIDRMDQGIGRIIAKLREIGAEENTLIIFLADNGGSAEILTPESQIPVMPEKTRDGGAIQFGNVPTVMPGPEDTYQSYGIGWANASNTPFRLYKHWVHEGGIAAPLVVSWPRVIRQPHELTHQVGHVIDLMATCLDVSAAEYPATYGGHEIRPLEGRSLVPIFRGETREGHSAVYWEHEGSRAIRQGDWKLVSRFEEEWELFDMKADRTETHNVAPRNGEQVQQMASLHDRWSQRVGAQPWSKIVDCLVDISHCREREVRRLKRKLNSSR